MKFKLLGAEISIKIKETVENENGEDMAGQYNIINREITISACAREPIIVVFHEIGHVFYSLTGYELQQNVDNEQIVNHFGALIATLIRENGSDIIGKINDFVEFQISNIRNNILKGIQS